MNFKVDCDLSSCLFCKSCTSEWLELTALRKQTRSFKRGEQLFTEGREVEGIYFTLSGAVKIHKQWSDQKELIIRFVSGGDVIGIRGFGDTVFSVSATALEPTIACYIPLEHMESSLSANPALTYKLMHVYAGELQRAEQRMSDLAHLNTKGRLAETLLKLKSIYGVDKEGFLAITISRQDIASYAGTIYETVFKIFTDWQNTAVIETKGKRIRVIKENELITYARQ